jgi:hypothetical protein
LVLEVEAHLEFLNQLTSLEGREEAYILDLIANADRRANIEGKYEDTVARQEEILKLLSLRNLFPLGYGENPVGQEGYARFRDLLVELLRIDEYAFPRFATLPL